ncbi:MAG: 23S rRNA (guanosine(2251)-2'-O)-methyltransferase RlmB [Clostridiales bacterium]|nr:23S rRNA (guanosine(2251)-2'-O)-methyltransferase RlmB [Clostridiales bacterium]
MTRNDHLRSNGTWEEEGTRYRRSSAQADEARRESAATKGNKPYGKPAPKNEKGGYQNRPAKPHHENHREEKPRFEQPAIRPERPAPKPAPVEREDAFLPPENLLSGRNPIREAIKTGRDIEKLLVAKGDLSGTAREIVAMARERHIPVQMVERTRLDEITRNHQGMLAFASAYRYYDVEDMLQEAQEKGEAPFLVVLDGVTDPQNLGAIIRTAACVGAHGVIVPERRAVGLTPSAVKASAGAIETVKVARVTNLTRTLEMLKNQGVWLYAADMVGDDYRKVDFSGPMALIIGAEGEGVSRLVLEASDHRVSLPMKGGVGSLNASVAAGVLLYAAFSSRG